MDFWTAYDILTFCTIGCPTSRNITVSILKNNIEFHKRFTKIKQKSQNKPWISIFSRLYLKIKSKWLYFYNLDCGLQNESDLRPLVSQDDHILRPHGPHAGETQMAPIRAWFLYKFAKLLSFWEIITSL